MANERLDRRPAYLIKRVQQLFRQAADARLRSIDLSMAQYAVLRALHDHPDASSAELARQTFVTRQSLHEVVRGLESSGLVTAAATGSAGGRARPLALTEHGRAKLRAAEDVVRTVEDDMLAGLSGGDQRHLADLLTSCVRNLDPTGT